MSIATIGVIALTTDVFGAGNSKHHAAQERCESDVLKRMASPSTTTLSGVAVAESDLDPETKDLFSLTLNDPLKGIDHARITVLQVSGEVNVQTELGSTLHQQFECRAYFVDDNLADTLVLLDHGEH